jgi:hypothetical protein
MPHETINRYLTDVLKPQLAALDVQDALVQHTLDTVRTQMASCIKHWNDVRFRHALLTVGDEEAGFYKPTAKYDVRSFVVVTVRNSALETIHTMTTDPNWKGKSLSPQKLREITAAAIEYFKDKDFVSLSNDIVEVKTDLYGGAGGSLSHCVGSTRPNRRKRKASHHLRCCQKSGQAQSAQSQTAAS